MFRYDQATGELSRNGFVLGEGYSGRGEGRNNPAKQAVRSVGPIPCGRYQIGPAYDTKNLGPLSIPLTPIGHNALGRSGFFIHGDNKAGDASHGCIILNRGVRQVLAAFRDADDELMVVFQGEAE